TVTTGDDGGFAVTLLPPGNYRLQVSAQSFKKANIAGVVVNITETTRQDVTLEPGNIQEVVNVEATPTLINPSSATTGQGLDSQTLRTLPLASPNFLFLLNLSTGVTGDPTDVRTAGRGSADVTVNGQRTSNNSVSLEGINVNDFNLAHFDTIPLPDPHAIEEFNVATSLYDASSGSKGGGAVGLVFKSGTKSWHGEAYWQHRNDWLNANEWFFNHNGIPRQKFLQNVLGFSGSGPLPFLGGSWFGNVQGLRARNGVNPNGSSTTVTSPNFPTNPDGTTSAALLSAKYGVATIDPTALNILNLKNSAFGGQFLVPRLGQPGCAPSGSNVRCVFA